MSDHHARSKGDDEPIGSLESYFSGMRAELEDTVPPSLGEAIRELHEASSRLHNETTGNKPVG